MQGARLLAAKVYTSLSPTIPVPEVLTPISYGIRYTRVRPLKLVAGYTDFTFCVDVGYLNYIDIGIDLVMALVHVLN